MDQGELHFDPVCALCMLENCLKGEQLKDEEQEESAAELNLMSAWENIVRLSIPAL